jgi:hypothetical protein
LKEGVGMIGLGGKGKKDGEGELRRRYGGMTT